MEPSNALNCRVWGIPAVISRGIPGKTLRAFPGSFRNFSGISSRKSQLTGGVAQALRVGPSKFETYFYVFKVGALLWHGKVGTFGEFGLK